VIALVTSEDFPSLEPDSQLLLPALAERQIDYRIVVWNDPGVDWSAFEAIVVRSPWDYYLHPGDWARWLDHVGATGVRMLNPLKVVRWNSHKSYLQQLAAAGIPVIDTVMTQGDAPVDLGDLLAGAGWSDAVVKPAIDGAARRLFRVTDVADPQARFDELVAAGDVLVQPFLPSIVTHGELSLLYFNGDLSHTVLKRTKGGDFRVQPEFGQPPALVEPPVEAVQIAEDVLAAIDADLLYARVDLVRGDDGTLRLIELEVIEPQLFLAQDPSAPARFADALSDAL
jgi:hypothetical protein